MKALLSMFGMSVFCCTCIVSSVMGASGSPESIAIEMLRNYSAISLVKGTFKCSMLARQDPEEVSRHFDGLIETSPDTMRKGLQRAKEDVIKMAAQSGYVGCTETFSGSFDNTGRLKMVESNGGNDYLYISDGEKALCYSTLNRVAELMDPKDPTSIIQGKRGITETVKDWMTGTNAVWTAEGMALDTGHEANSSGIVVLEHTPIGEVAGMFKRTIEVCIDKGHVPQRIEVYHASTGRLLRVIENRNIMEVRPGIWRPMKRVSTLYEMTETGDVVASRITTLEWDQIDGINDEVDEADFEVKAPHDVIGVVDSRDGTAFDLETDDTDGIEGIEAALLELPGNATAKATNSPSDKPMRIEDAIYARDTTVSTEDQGRTTQDSLGNKTVAILCVCALFVAAGIVLAKRKQPTSPDH